jgi:polyferredoxin
MSQLVAGILVLLIGCIALWYCLPRNGKPRSFVGTLLEPYIGAAFIAALAVGGTLIFSSVIAWRG